jgi:sugar/nucleoside kinase (ribokinase family)
MSVTAIGSISRETINTEMGQLDNIPGGELAYFSMASRILSKTRLITAIGNDYPKEGLDKLQQDNIDIDNISIIKSKESPTHLLVYKNDLYNPVEEEKRMEIYDDYPFEKSLEETKPNLLYVGELKSDIQKRILDKTRPMKTKTMTAAPSMEIKMNPACIKKILKSSSIIIMEYEDIVALNKNNNIINGARNIFPTKGLDYLIMLNRTSVMLMSKSRLSMMTVYPVEKVIDMTGYKYAFAGAFLSYIDFVGAYTFETMVGALLYANIVSSFSIEGLGINGFYNININRIIDRCEEYKTMVTIPEINSKIINI